MALERCERCGREAYVRERCTYCGRAICVGCKKASKRLRKVFRFVICRDCWGNIERRRRWRRGER